MCMCTCARRLSTYHGTIGIFVIIVFSKMFVIILFKNSNDLTTHSRTHHDTRTGEAIALT